MIDAAARLGVPTVGTFVGRDPTKNVPDNFREFRKVWPRLVAYAEGKGVAPDPQSLAGIRHRGRVSHATYFRILAPELLPASLSRVIYLDADVRVASDLSRLWAEPLREHPVLAVRDAGAPLVSSPRGLVNHRELGLAPELGYFNAGVMLLDLARWRAEPMIWRSERPARSISAIASSSISWKCR